MKKSILLVALMMSTAFTLVAQEINFEAKQHDFGTIPQDIPVTHEFVFANSGTAPLIISAADGSCGCTVPEWPREPIMPGKSGRIKVTFNAKAMGPFQKSVTITSNDPNSPTELRIKGNVESKS